MASIVIHWKGRFLLVTQPASQRLDRDYREYPVSDLNAKKEPPLEMAAFFDTQI